MDITTSTDPETGKPVVTATIADESVTATVSDDRTEIHLFDAEGESMVMSVADARSFAAVLTAIVNAVDNAAPGGMTPHRA